MNHAAVPPRVHSSEIHLWFLTNILAFCTNVGNRCIIMIIRNFFTTDSQTKMTLKLGWEGWGWGFPKPCDFFEVVSPALLVFPSLVTCLKLCHLLFWFSQALWLFWSCVTCFFCHISYHLVIYLVVGCWKDPSTNTSWGLQLVIFVMGLFW